MSAHVFFFAYAPSLFLCLSVFAYFFIVEESIAILFAGSIVSLFTASLFLSLTLSLSIYSLSLSVFLPYLLFLPLMSLSPSLSL